MDKVIKIRQYVTLAEIMVRNRSVLLPVYAKTNNK